MFKLQTTSNDMLHLDMMRFIASVGIVVHHSVEYFFPAYERPLIHAQTDGLALFVDLFFIISGYVITYVYSGRVGSLREYGLFFQRRIGRLFPLHWLTMVVVMALFAAARLAGFSGKHDPSFDPVCILDTALLMQSYVPCGNGEYFNGVSWSISTEMVMYALFPFFAVMGRRMGKRLFLVVAGILGVILGGALIDGVEPLSSLMWAYIHPVTRALPSFLFGCALFLNRELMQKIPMARAGLVVMTTALLMGMVTAVSQLSVLACVYGVAVLAVACDVQRKESKIVQAIAPAGQLTYSIYMWHWSVIFVVMNALGDKILHLDFPKMMALAVVCYVGIAVISVISYFWIETPARRWIDKLPLFTEKKMERVKGIEPSS